MFAILGSLFWRALDLTDRKRMLTWAPRKLYRTRPEVPAENPKMISHATVYSGVRGLIHHESVQGMAIPGQLPR